MALLAAMSDSILRTAASALLLLTLAAPAASRQASPAPTPAETTSPFTYRKLMVPMRDGTRLETVILTPRDAAGPLPILLQRTPYGVPGSAPAAIPANWAALAKDGYIFVFQSMRGRFGSDGAAFTLSTELRDGSTDEASDGYDTIEWLLKNVPANNGRVGMWGVSYPGLAAAIALAQAGVTIAPFEAWIDAWRMSAVPPLSNDTFAPLQLRAAGADFDYALRLDAQRPQGEGDQVVLAHHHAQLDELLLVEAVGTM